MVETGVTKYDELPSRIGFTDIDALRFSYIKLTAKLYSYGKKLEKVESELNGFALGVEENDK